MIFLREIVSASGACAASGFLSWAAVAPSSQVFGSTFRRTGDTSSLAVTFDDGPNPAITPAILDLLESYQVRATFFVIGKWVNADPGLTQEITARGHVVANHTYTHPRLTFCSRQGIEDELSRCDDAIISAVGKQPRWMRPPYGYRSPFLAPIVRDRGDKGIVMWSSWAKDWKPQPASRTIGRLEKVRGGDILLLHDGDPMDRRAERRHVVEALEYWLPRWRDAGLNFVTMDAVTNES